MDKISGLPDDVLVKILSFVPTKVAVSTSILSKRWEFLWMWLPRLEYTSFRTPELRDFIDKNLPLHRAPIIESLCLESDSRDCNPEDIRRWIEIAVSRHVRELKISYDSRNKNIFPSSLYTCKSLVTLKLEWVALMDIPSMVCLPSLKSLQLEDVKFVDEGILQELLSICPVLEDLSVECGRRGTMTEFTIIVPSLRRLSLFLSEYFYLDGYVIDTPSLNYLKLEDWNSSDYSLIENMPNLREAYVDVRHNRLKDVIESITSVKHLTICSEDMYGDGFIFNQLEHLNLCVCKEDSSNFLGQMLKDSPKLRVLEISEEDHRMDDERNGMVSWNPPSPVPECLLSSLQIFKWSRYFGRPQDRDIAVYILNNARHLKTATILADTDEHCVPNLKMLKELALSPRASSTCQLVFVEDLNCCVTLTDI